jgi:WD40 repeat protein
VLVLEGPRQRLDDVVLSQDGRFAACAGGNEIDNGLLLWDIVAGRRIALNPFVLSPSRNSYAFSNDGRLFTANTLQGIVAFDPTSGRLTTQGEAQQNSVRAITIHPDRNMLIGYLRGRLPTPDNLRWFDAAGRSLNQNGFRTDDLIVHSLAFARDGSALVTRGTNGLNLFEVASRELLRHWPIGDRVGTSLALSPDGRFAAFPQRYQLHVVDLTGGDGGTAIPHSGRKWFQAAAFTADGRYLAIVDGTSTVRFLESPAWKERHAYDWHVGELRGIAFTADGLRGVAVSAKGHLVIWDQDF